MGLAKVARFAWWRGPGRSGLVVAALVAGLVVAAGGCRGGGGQGAGRGANGAGANSSLAGPGNGVGLAPGITPLASRIDVIVGRRAVIPVTVGAGVDPNRPVVVKLDDGRTPATVLRQIEIAPQPADGLWAPPAGVWRVLEPGMTPRPDGRTLWVLAIELPDDGLGQGAWVNGKRWALNWVASPEMLIAQHPQLEWASPLKPDARASPGLLKLMEPERASPARRWRYRLIVDGLRSVVGRGGSIVDATVASLAFTDPLLESMATETEARWAVALGRLRATHPDVTRRLTMRLAMAVEFAGPLGRRDGGAVYAPAWPVDQGDLDRLVGDLLDPNLSAERRAQRAEVWLASRPAAVGWVIDDARAAEGTTGASLSTLGIANLSDGATLGWVGLDGSTAGPPGMTPVPASTARVFTLAGEGGSRVGTRENRAAATMTFHAGSWRAAGSVMSTKLAVMPPGLTIGPLSEDWTMADWLGASASANTVAGEWATAARAYRAGGREASGDRAGTRPGERASGWVVYVECRRPAGATGEAPEFVRLWMGPTGRARAVVRVAPDEQDASQPGVKIVREVDRWAVQIDVPESAIEADGTLRIGLERGDARGVRSAWPRRMLPWQTEPGRVAIDTTAWSGLSAERE